MIKSAALKRFFDDADRTSGLGRRASDPSHPARVLAMFAAMFADVRVLADVRAAPRPGVRDARTVVARATRPGDGRRDDSRFSSRPSNNAVPYRRRVPLIDYYAVLDVPPESSSDEIRAAWRALQKSVHPDLAGDHAAAAAALVNEAFEILTSPSHRASFDADRDEWLAHGANDDLALVDPTPLSAWSGPDPREPAGARGRHDAAFVDESRCVGCLQCALHAPETFHVETRFGKARVVNQWADGRDAVEDAVDACPVRCIHFVDRVAELPLLERVAARLWKEGGAAFGGPASSPFEVAESLRRRAAGPGGIAPWPSRRRRGGSNGRPNGGGEDASRVDSSAANAAVAAAVAAAAKAAERRRRRRTRGPKRNAQPKPPRRAVRPQTRTTVRRIETVPETPPKCRSSSPAEEGPLERSRAAAASLRRRRRSARPLRRTWRGYNPSSTRTRTMPSRRATESRRSTGPRFPSPSARRRRRSRRATTEGTRQPSGYKTSENHARRASSHRARHETRQEARREARGDGTHPGSKARILATRRRPRSV